MNMTNTEKLIKQARTEGRLTFSEFESKKILKSLGVPVANEAVVKTVHEAVTCADQMGYPVVLKGHGSKLSHKTERGLVRVNIKSQAELRQAFHDITKAAGDDAEGCLLQHFIEGRREFVAGLSRDPQFGPVVMFGLGGIFTEALADAAFRIVPIDEKQASRMIEEISSRKLLKAFRGEAPADTAQLIKVLTGLSELAVKHPDIREVDINPLIITPRGKVVAVDALVVLDENTNQQDPPVSGHMKQVVADIETMTHPKSIAVIGATRSSADGFPGMFANIVNFGYKGELYPINPHADEIQGYKAYHTLKAVGKPVDLVVVSVPAHRVPAALKDCVASGSKNVHIFSSGFKEAGEEEGVRLQQELEDIARKGNLNIIGPNCMGLYVPSSKIVTWVDAPATPGSVAFVSQSGGNAQDYTAHAAEKLGVYFSKVFSYGNALTLDSTDFLEYLALDDETKIITMYLEGVKNGPRLMELVTRINKNKPVIINKAGLTESGARAVSSHTGSMAGGEKIWNAFFRQTGAVRVESIEEMAEVASAFDKLGKISGRGIAVIGTGGGIGVAAADASSHEGLNLAPFSPDLMAKLREFIPPAGNMIRNPLDAHLILIEPALLGRSLELLSAESYLNMFVISLHIDWLYSRGHGEVARGIARYIVDEARKHTAGKPLVVSLRQFSQNDIARETIQSVKKILLAGRVPFYEGIPRAVAALAKVVKYHEFQSNNS